MRGLGCREGGEGYYNWCKRFYHQPLHMMVEVMKEKKDDDKDGDA